MPLKKQKHHGKLKSITRNLFKVFILFEITPEQDGIISADDAKIVGVISDPELASKWDSLSSHHGVYAKQLNNEALIKRIKKEVKDVSRRTNNRLDAKS
jgi:hypothetical protein